VGGHGYQTRESASLSRKIGGPFFNSFFCRNFFLRDVTPARSAFNPSDGVATADRRREPDRYTRPGQPSQFDCRRGLHKHLPGGSRRQNDLTTGVAHHSRLVSPNRAVLINRKTARPMPPLRGCKARPSHHRRRSGDYQDGYGNPSGNWGAVFLQPDGQRTMGQGLATGVVVTDSLPPTVTFALASSARALVRGPHQWFAR